MDTTAEVYRERLGEVETQLLLVVEKTAIAFGCQLRFAMDDANDSKWAFNLDYDPEISATSHALDYLEGVLSYSDMTPEQFDEALFKGVKYGIKASVQQ